MIDFHKLKKKKKKKKKKIVVDDVRDITAAGTPGIKWRLK